MQQAALQVLPNLAPVISEIVQEPHSSALVCPALMRGHRLVDFGDEVLDIERLGKERGDQAVPQRGRDAGL